MSRTAAAFAACKADWSKARANYGSWVRDEFLLDLITATNKFLGSPQGREAFRGGWTSEELFGITFEPPHQLGLVCAVVNASLAIVRFDGGWVFVKTPAMPGEEGSDSVLRYFRSAFQYNHSVSWWRHPTYGRINPPRRWGRELLARWRIAASTAQEGESASIRPEEDRLCRRGALWQRPD